MKKYFMTIVTYLQMQNKKKRIIFNKIKINRLCKNIKIICMIL